MKPVNRDVILVYKKLSPNAESKPFPLLIQHRTRLFVTMFLASLFATLVCGLLVIPGHSYEPDRVTSLPGLEIPIEFKTYSGYLNATQGTHFHYIFIESQRDPANDPLLLWLNGGPGCSSLLGFFTEQGPFRFKNGSLDSNAYSWNKVANMIFLESPAGVGYSYSDSRNYSHNDDETSLNNLLALKSFFNKFPSYKENDFYVTGESYAGVYIPTLSIRLLDEPQINYKGFAIGNGYLDQHLLGNSVVRFAYYHGLIDSSTWGSIVTHCCEDGDESPSKCEFVSNKNAECRANVNKATAFINNSKVNPYAIYEDCNTQFFASGQGSVLMRSNRKMLGWKLLHKTLKYNATNVPSTRGVTDDSGGETIPCVDDSLLMGYLSRSDVREALHIPSDLPGWFDCSADVSSHYTMQYPTLRRQVANSIKAGKRGLIYNGDTDMVCDFLGDEWFSDSLGFQSIGSYEPWYVNDQVAGFVKHYQGFAYATIRGSGHTVPEYRPAAALAMIERFLGNNKLA